MKLLGCFGNCDGVFLQWFYYFAVVEDFILRFAWAFSMSLTETGYIHADLMITILAPLEVFRSVCVTDYIPGVLIKTSRLQ